MLAWHVLDVSQPSALGGSASPLGAFAARHLDPRAARQDVEEVALNVDVLDGQRGVFTAPEADRDLTFGEDPDIVAAGRDGLG